MAKTLPATTTITITHHKGDLPKPDKLLKDKGYFLAELSNHIAALGGGTREGRITVSRDGGTDAVAATGTVTLAGSAGGVTVTVGGIAVGPVAAAASDTLTATAMKNALNANSAVAQLVTATSVGAVVTLTAVEKGTDGNSISLASSATSGTATRSAATLTGGTEADDYASISI